MARVLVVIASVLVLIAGGTWWFALSRDRSALVRSAVAAPMPPDAAEEAAEPDALDLRGDVVELPEGVKFIVPPRLVHDWASAEHRTVVFGDGGRIVALANVTKGKKLALDPKREMPKIAKRSRLAVTASEDYAPGRTYFRLDGENEKGEQLQERWIYIDVPGRKARVSVIVVLTGAIILDPRIGELVAELRDGRVVTP